MNEKNLTMGSFCLIDDTVKFGENVRLGNYVQLGEKTVLGDNCYVGDRISIQKTTIGKNVTIEDNATIGSESFTFQDDIKTISQFGVIIKDHVWIGGSSRVMLGTTRDTYIGKNVKIGQACNIGHDSIIEDTSTISFVNNLAGYVSIGKGSYIGMGSLIRNRIKIGRLSFVGMGSNVVKDIPDNVIAFGNPCKVISKRFKPISHYVQLYVPKKIRRLNR